MIKKLKKSIAFLLIMCLFIQGTNCFVFAQNNYSLQSQISHMSSQQKDFMIKLEAMFDEFVFENGSLNLKRPIEEIKQIYLLNDFDLEMINNMKKIDKLAKQQPPSNVYIEDWKLCFDYGELNVWLFAAASAGPTALIAAFEAIGAALGGPIGVVVASIVAALGGANPIQICGEIVTACAHGWGWYIGVDPLHFQIVHDYIC